MRSHNLAGECPLVGKCYLESTFRFPYTPGFIGGANMADKYLCPTAAEYRIEFKCPYPQPDCAACEAFGNTKHKHECFKKIPKDEDVTDFDTMTEEQQDAALETIFMGHYYNETGNRAYAMRAFVTALDEGLYPPLWALKTVGDVFRKFLKPTTKRTISTLFGCGPGRNLVKEMQGHDRRESIRRRIEQEHLKGRSLRPNFQGDDATSFVEYKDGKEPGQYEHIAKKSPTPLQGLNRAIYKKRRKTLT
jgi:hypothetical protein